MLKALRGLGHSHENAPDKSVYSQKSGTPMTKAEVTAFKRDIKDAEVFLAKRNALQERLSVAEAAAKQAGAAADAAGAGAKEAGVKAQNAQARITQNLNDIDAAQKRIEQNKTLAADKRAKAAQLQQEEDALEKEERALLAMLATKQQAAKAIAPKSPSKS